MAAFSEQWFRSKGFADAPTYVEGKGTETLYRVYGGATSRIIGSCFSFQRPGNVSSAERDSNIAKWGNLCLYVATFSVVLRAPMWVGRIDQSFSRKDLDDGNDVVLDGDRNAQQVWIDPKRAAAYLILIGYPTRLIQDKVIHAGVAHA